MKRSISCLSPSIAAVADDDDVLRSLHTRLQMCHQVWIYLWAIMDFDVMIFFLLSFPPGCCCNFSLKLLIIFIAFSSCVRAHIVLFEFMCCRHIYNMNEIEMIFWSDWVLKHSMEIYLLLLKERQSVEMGLLLLWLEFYTLKLSYLFETHHKFALNSLLP
jgi:hypothetical protein